MPPSARDLLDQCLLLDVEVNEKGEIYSLGAVFGEQTFPIPTKTRINQAVLENLDAFAAGARFILGHKILKSGDTVKMSPTRIFKPAAMATAGMCRLLKLLFDSCRIRNMLQAECLREPFNDHTTRIHCRQRQEPPADH